jgi:hypothetical protein
MCTARLSVPLIGHTPHADSTLTHDRTIWGLVEIGSPVVDGHPRRAPSGAMPFDGG